MLRLQGLPENLLDHAPFTMHGKRSAIGNAVPMPMGRALARAVLAWIGSNNHN
jgi:site-specific DNA-cytosine methylase